MRVKTVVVDRGGSPVTINESDFRGSDTLWADRQKPKAVTKKVTKKKARKK